MHNYIHIHNVYNYKKTINTTMKYYDYAGIKNTMYALIFVNNHLLKKLYLNYTLYLATEIKPVTGYT